MSICKRYLVSGRVQGVYYRASARAQAQQLGLEGYARNLPDGRVEVLACGAAKDLQALQAWLRQGPARAEVSNVTEESVSRPGGLSGFETA